MSKLSRLQMETMEYCKQQIDAARRQNLDMDKMKGKDYIEAKRILDAQNGIVYTQGGNCTIRTLRKLEELGLIEILEDNSGIGMGCGAFPSKVKVLNY